MDFVRIANFNNQFEAETVAHLLDGEDIPYNIHSNEALFGEGGVGPYVFLSVAGDQEEKARAILASVSGDGTENI
ncbi:DUF2007 domain-containing protein [Kiritimatiellaeota bacterium B1221]|nr:DUF2007 domain-containing protein [Kiritimatiellaeota bacterium B1221]